MRRSALTVQESGGRVPFVDRLRPEHVISTRSDDGLGELVDQWGRSHALGPVALIGRDQAAAAIVVTDDSVSRRHAELMYDAAEHAWIVRDLGSSNGTFVDGQRIQCARISDRQIVSVGDISFAFLALPRRRSAGPWTFSRMRNGRSSVACGEARAQLDQVQTRCLALLVDRQRADEARSEALRGFVRSPELHGAIGGPLVRERPIIAKRVLRGVEAALASIGIYEAIETHERLGTRLKTASRPRE